MTMQNFEELLPEYICKYLPLLSKGLLFKIKDKVLSLVHDDPHLNDYAVWRKVIEDFIADSPDLILTDQWYALIAAETLYAFSVSELHKTVSQYPLSPPLRAFSFLLPVSPEQIEEANNRVITLSEKYFSLEGQGLLEVAIAYRLFNSIAYYYRRYNQSKRIWEELYPTFLEYDKAVQQEYAENLDLILEWRAAILVSLLNASQYDKRGEVFENIFTELKAIIDSVTNRNVLGIYYYVIGYYYLNSNELQEGESALVLAQEQYRHIGDENRVAALKVAVGNVYLDQSDYQKVIKEVKEALEILTKQSINYNSLVAMMMIITAYKYENKLEEGKSYYELIKSNLSLITKQNHPELLHNTANVAYLYRDFETIDILEQVADEMKNNPNLTPYHYLRIEQIKELKLLQSPNLEQRLAITEKMLDYCKEINFIKEYVAYLSLKIRLLLQSYWITKSAHYLRLLEKEAETLSHLIPKRSSPHKWILSNLALAYVYVLTEKFSSAKITIKLIDEVMTTEQSLSNQVYYKFLKDLLDKQQDNLWKKQNLPIIASEYYLLMEKDKDRFNEQLFFMTFVDLLHTTEALAEKEKHAYEEPEIYALFIINSQGVSIYSYVIDQNITIDDQLFGGFISAITAFSSELIKTDKVGSASLLKAIDYKDWTLLLNPKPEMTTVLVAEDQSLEVWQQLETFSQLLDKIPERIKQELDLGVISEGTQECLDNFFNEVFLKEKSEQSRGVFS